MLEWYEGPNLKTTGSFMELLSRAEDDPFCALCDQDDVWMPDKLMTAVNRLQEVSEEEPALYYGATLMTDENLNPLKKQNRVVATESVAQALVFPLVTGCTMCMNRTLVKMVNSRPCKARNIHDFWIHKICLVTGGYCICDPEPHIYYRQHGNNVAGGAQSGLHRLRRYIRMGKKDQNLRSNEIRWIMNLYHDSISEENKTICKQVDEYNQSVVNRVKLACDSRFRSGVLYWDLLFIIAVLTGSL